MHPPVNIRVESEGLRHRAESEHHTYGLTVTAIKRQLIPARMTEGTLAGEGILNILRDPQENIRK